MGLHEGDLEGGLLSVDPKDMLKRNIKRDVKNALETGISKHRGHVGEHGGESLARTC